VAGIGPALIALLVALTPYLGYVLAHLARLALWVVNLPLSILAG
jgi:hypothetical protein